MYIITGEKGDQGMPGPKGEMGPPGEVSAANFDNCTCKSPKTFCFLHQMFHCTLDHDGCLIEHSSSVLLLPQLVPSVTTYTTVFRNGGFVLCIWQFWCFTFGLHKHDKYVMINYCSMFSFSSKVSIDRRTIRFKRNYVALSVFNQWYTEFRNMLI